MKKRFLSDSVQRHRLPSHIIDQIEREARRKKIKGKGKFCYVPVSMLGPKGRIDFVVTFFYAKVHQRNIRANKGDVSITLRREWNVKDNPLG